MPRLREPTEVKTPGALREEGHLWNQHDELLLAHDVHADLQTRMNLPRSQPRPGRCLALVLLVLLMGESCTQAGPSIPLSPCFLGLEAPADLAFFSPRSPWRTPVDADAGVHRDSALQLETLRSVLESQFQLPPVLTVNATRWTAPIHFVDAEACPPVSVASTGGLHESVDPDGDGRVDGLPIPEGAWADSEEDGHMVIVDARQRKAWEFSRFGRNIFGGWTTSTHAQWNLDGLGTMPPFSGERWWRAGSTGSAAPLVGGIITLAEMQRQRIDHALGIALPTTGKSASKSEGSTFELCRPVAARTDGLGLGPEFILEGARLQLDPNLDLDALGLNSAARTIARALQVYGAYVWDSGRGFSLRAQNLGSESWRWSEDLAPNLDRLPFDRFRVLDCDVAAKP
jgi:hypothetical protein